MSVCGGRIGKLQKGSSFFSVPPPYTRTFFSFHPPSFSAFSVTSPNYRSLLRTQQVFCSIQIANESRRRARYTGAGWYNGDSYVSRYNTLQVREDDIFEFLNRKKLEYYESGGEIILKYCPNCHDHKNSPDNLNKLYVSKENGTFFCHRCRSKGSWFDFKRDHGAGRNDIGPVMQVKEKPKDQGPLPTIPANTSKEYIDNLWTKRFSGVLRVLCGKHYEGTDDNGALYADTKPRHIKPEVLKKYQVGCTTRTFASETGPRLHTCITFPWIEPKGADDYDHPNSLDSEQETVRIKLRSVTDKSKQRLEPKGGGWGFFGWHTVPDDAKEIVLTEGEYDAMAVYQETGIPSISLPNGAASLPNNLIPRLERFPKIYLWMDDDVPGQEGATLFSTKLGRTRCYVVKSKDGQAEGPKDANEALIEGKDFKHLLSKAAIKSHAQIATFKDIASDIFTLMSDPDHNAGVPLVDFPKFHRILGGHRRGELTVFSGETGCGKTTFLSQLTVSLAKQNVATLWGSFEIKNTQLARKMLLQLTQTTEEEVVEQWDQVSQQFQDLPIYFMKFFGSSDVYEVLDAMSDACYAHDVTHIVLDNLQFMLSGMEKSLGRNATKFDLQDIAIEEFRKFATRNNVHVTVVIHPRKQYGTEMLGSSTVYGSVKSVQEADNVVIIQKSRKEPEFRSLTVEKNRYNGNTGRVTLRFNQNTLSFTDAFPSDDVDESTDDEAEQDNGSSDEM